MSLPVERDRRDNSALGLVRRQRFEESLDLLRDTGLSAQLIDHYRRHARETRQLPHELVRRDVRGHRQHLSAGEIRRSRAAPREATSAD